MGFPVNAVECRLVFSVLFTVQMPPVYGAAF